MKAWREAVDELLGWAVIPEGQVTDALDDDGYPLDGLLYRRNDPIPGLVELAREGVEPIVVASAWAVRPNLLYLKTGRQAMNRHYYDSIRMRMADKDRLSTIFWRPSESDEDWVRGWEVWVRR